MQKTITSLLTLQNLMKRDPAAYTAEYNSHMQQFTSNVQLMQIKQNHNTALNKQFQELIIFLAHVSPCFPQQVQSYADSLIHLLQHHSTLLDSELRLTIVQSIILLQHKTDSCIDRNTLYPTLFRLFTLPDKQLRTTVFTHMIADIKLLVKRKAVKLNSRIQNYIYSIVTKNKSQPNTVTKTSTTAAQPADDDTVLTKYALDIIVECWRRELWTDEKMVNCVAYACTHGAPAVRATALNFFLGVKTLRQEQAEAEDDDRVEQQKTVQTMKASIKGIVKNKKKRNKLVDRAQKKLKSDSSENLQNGISATRAITLLHDAQSFVEQLFAQLKASHFTFNLRLLHMNIISRVVYVHQLILLNYYPYMQKYMQPHQKFVTLILTYFAQSVHPMVPPDILQPCVRTLCNNFVSDRSSIEVMTIGLNCIREVCTRQPLCITDDLVGDLVQYNKSKHKSVVIAARSLLALFRERNPAALTRKLRGRTANQTRNQRHTQEYGAEQVNDDIADVELFDDAELNDKVDEEGEMSEIEFDDDELPSDSELPSEDEQQSENESADVTVAADVDDNAAEVDDIEAEDVEGEEMLELSGSDVAELDEEGDDVDDEDIADEQPADEVAIPADAADVPTVTPPVKALPKGATKIFTDEDFARLRQLKATQLTLGNKGNSKRKLAELSDSDSDADNTLVDENSIIGYRSKFKQSRAERVAAILEGRANAAQNQRKGGTSNLDKLKHKNAVMVMHSRKVREKQKGTSFSEKQKRTGKHIKTLKMMSKRTAKKIKRGKGK